MQRRAQELNPVEHRSDYANSLMRAGRYDEARDEAKRAVELIHSTIVCTQRSDGRSSERDITNKESPNWRRPFR